MLCRVFAAMRILRNLRGASRVPEWVSGPTDFLALKVKCTALHYSACAGAARLA